MAIGTSAAILGSAAIGAGASVIGASRQSGAARSAANMTAEANNAAIAEQRRVYDQNRADNAPTLARGNMAGDEVSRLLGLGGGQGGQQPGGVPDYDAYVRNNPTNEASFQQYGAPAGMTRAQWGEQLDRDYGAQDGLDVPTMPGAMAEPGFGPSPAFGPEMAPREAYTRPGEAARPTYDRGPQTARPEFARGADPALDVSLGAYQQSPDYEFQQKEAERGINAQVAARGLSGSGAALKALQDRRQNIAMGDYGQWRDYATNRFDTNRNMAEGRFGADRAYGAGAFSEDRTFGENSFINDRTFGENAFRDTRDNRDRNFETDRAYGSSIYESDRGYGANRFDTRLNALQGLAGAGQTAVGQNAASGQNFASAYGNALNSTAQARGDASQIGAQQFSNAFSTIGGIASDLINPRTRAGSSPSISQYAAAGRYY